MNNKKKLFHSVVAFTLIACVSNAVRAELIGNEPVLGPLKDRTTQADISGFGLLEARKAGLKIFAAPFRKSDGYGDGPYDPANPDATSPGNRPSLLGNTTFLRVNGLDSQTCMECHCIVSNATIPSTFGVGGAGGSNNSALPKVKYLDLTAGYMDGRFINPPALFGSGGVQLLAKEMTSELQGLKQEAVDNPNVAVNLETKGVYFGAITADHTGTIDFSGIEGIDEDLIVRPFGRKGEFISVREFALGAFQFHMGMQPAELYAANEDNDGDGVSNEVLAGEVSALEIFVTSQETPSQDDLRGSEKNGYKLFKKIGCAHCHRPSLLTNSRFLSYSFPEVVDDPSVNQYFSTDLTQAPMRFEENGNGGVIVPLFADLKRHDMGPELAESLEGVSDEVNRQFTTAKLWGVADTAPYLHDGRALTLSEAILAHGGEAQGPRDAFAGLNQSKQNQLLKFLMSLKNPRSPNQDVVAE